MDRLCMALAYKLERDNSNPVETEPTPQSIQEPTQERFDGASQQPVPPMETVYLLSNFPTVEEVLKLCGIEDPAVREQYVKNLVQHGFETPIGIVGAAGDVQLLREMGIKLGHAIRLAQLLLKF